jgi:hypothetical protein
MLQSAMVHKHATGVVGRSRSRALSCDPVPLHHGIKSQTLSAWPCAGTVHEMGRLYAMSRYMLVVSPES